MRYMLQTAISPKYRVKSVACVREKHARLQSLEVHTGIRDCTALAMYSKDIPVIWAELHSIDHITYIIILKANTEK